MVRKQEKISTVPFSFIACIVRVDRGGFQTANKTKEEYEGYLCYDENS